MNGRDVTYPEVAPVAGAALTDADGEREDDSLLLLEAKGVELYLSHWHVVGGVVGV